jgi:endonuclease-3
MSEEKRTLALEVIRRLKEAYPLAQCTLDYRDAWQLLVSVRLAAQCTDARVDIVTPQLYAKFPTVAALAAAAEVDAVFQNCLKVVFSAHCLFVYCFS